MTIDNNPYLSLSHLNGHPSNGQATHMGEHPANGADRYARTAASEPMDRPEPVTDATAHFGGTGFDATGVDGTDGTGRQRRGFPLLWPPGRPFRQQRRVTATDRLFGDELEDEPGPSEGEPDGDADGADDGGMSYAADRSQWRDLKGPTPRGLRRSGLLDQLGWYEVYDREPALTSTRQVVATNPALIRSQPPFAGNAIGVDVQTGMYVGSDQYVLYDGGVLQSINGIIVGDVGVGKTSLVQNHYLQNAIYAGRQVCCFDRKRNADTQSEYAGVARIIEASGKRVARIRFDRNDGARVNILDPRIVARGSDQTGRVGQDELLMMVAVLLRGGPLTSFERYALSAAHKKAETIAAGQGRVPVLGDVVDALFQPSTDYLPKALRDGDHIGEVDMLNWGLALGFDLNAALDGELSGLINGPTRDADGNDLDLAADLIIVDTSSLQDGSVALMLVMAIMSTFISSVWSTSGRKSVLIIEEGYSADFPSVAAILRTLAKRGRGVGVSLLMVLHHLSDIPTGSDLASLFKEAGVIHLLRQAQLAEAQHTCELLGLGDFTSTIQSLSRGSHILVEGRPESRPPRIVSHVRTDMDRWANYSDAAITGGTNAPASPFPGDDPFAADETRRPQLPDVPPGQPDLNDEPIPQLTQPGATR